MILARQAAASAAAGPYQWVAVGASGNLATSENSSSFTWTARTSSFGTTAINFVKASGLGTYVAVGATGKLATSTDGITWTQRTSSFSTSDILGVAYGNGVWVAVGAAGKVATATDPTGTWTQRTTGFSGTVNVVGVYYGNNLWVAINKSGEIRTATDPTATWTLRTSTLTNGAGPPRWCPNQSVWVAGIDSLTSAGAFASSTDGLTWTARTSPQSTIGGLGYFLSNANTILSYYSASVSAVNRSRGATSSDGATWTDQSGNTNSLFFGYGAVDTAGMMLLPGSANNLQTTSDGINYTSGTGPTFEALCVAHVGGG